MYEQSSHSVTVLKKKFDDIKRSIQNIEQKQKEFFTSSHSLNRSLLSARQTDSLSASVAMPRRDFTPDPPRDHLAIIQRLERENSDLAGQVLELSNQNKLLGKENTEQQQRIATLEAELRDLKRFSSRPEEASRPEIGQRPESGFRPDQLPRGEQRTEAGYRSASGRAETGYRSDVGARAEAGYRNEAGLRADAGYRNEAGLRTDTYRSEAGLRADTYRSEAGLRADAGYRSDGGARGEAGLRSELGLRTDTGYRSDSGLRTETGYRSDGQRAETFSVTTTPRAIYQRTADLQEPRSRYTPRDFISSYESAPVLSQSTSLSASKARPSSIIRNSRSPPKHNRVAFNSQVEVNHIDNEEPVSRPYYTDPLRRDDSRPYDLKSAYSRAEETSRDYGRWTGYYKRASFE